jgi:hypothetical protein
VELQGPDQLAAVGLQDPAAAIADGLAWGRRCLLDAVGLQDLLL